MGLISSIKEFKQKYNDDDFIKHNKLSTEVLNYYIANYEVDWFCISKYQTLSEAFIEKYSDKVSWIGISNYQPLSEPFIEKYINKVDWYYISKYQTLSEAFIEKYRDNVNWYKISTYQPLSETFIEKYIDRVRWYSLLRNKKLVLSYEFIKNNIYNFNLYTASISIDNINISKLVSEYSDKYSVDKISYEINS